MAIDAVELTRKLVRIDSTTYHEGECGEFLAGFLAGEGWTIDRHAVEKPAPGTPGAEGGGERFNVYAHSGEQPDVVLSTHFDTVPPFLEFGEDDEFLYGRGTCDAKGIAAAMIAAADRLRPAACEWPCCLLWARSAIQPVPGWPMNLLRGQSF